MTSTTWSLTCSDAAERTAGDGTSTPIATLALHEIAVQALPTRMPASKVAKSGSSATPTVGALIPDPCSVTAIVTKSTRHAAKVRCSTKK